MAPLATRSASVVCATVPGPEELQAGRDFPARFSGYALVVEPISITTGSAQHRVAQSSEEMHMCVVALRSRFPAAPAQRLANQGRLKAAVAGTCSQGGRRR